MLKRGMSATIEEWLMAAEYIAQRGNLDRELASIAQHLSPLAGRTLTPALDPVPA